MYINLNLNPFHRRADDCVVRAIAKILDKSWEEVYADLCLEGLRYYDMPSANHVWGSYLKKKGFQRHIIPDTCPQCYTVRQFTEDHPQGRYVLAISGHAVASVGKDYFDSFDSGDCVVVYYWTKEA